MPKLALLFALALPLAASAQGIVTVSPQQCVWRTGDDGNWAAASLDESGWLPYSGFTLNSSQPRFWIRCHLDPSTFSGLEHPAVQVRFFGAYEVFVNSASIARNGDLASGHFHVNSIRVFPVPRTVLSPTSNVVALRVVRRFAMVVFIGLTTAPEIRAGDEQLLVNDRGGYLMAQAPSLLLSELPSIILGIIGFVLLAFSLADHSRREPILLALTCILVGMIFSVGFCGEMMVNLPDWIFVLLSIVPSALNSFTQNSFFFAVAGRRMPLIYWLLAAIWAAQAPWLLVELMLPAGTALRLDTILAFAIFPVVNIAMAALATAPFVAFWPWSQIPKRTRAIAVFCIAWGTVLSAFFLSIALINISFTGPGISNFFARSLSFLAPGQAIAQLFVFASVAALVMRDQRQTGLDRASLAGEMRAAGDIQQMLAPAKVDAAPGMRIDVAFHPMREVGGDFYLCRVLPDGRQRVLLGDVSGKGAAAAMAATLILGAASARESDSPAALLAHLNRVLRENNLSGFATCLCADVAPNGSASIANAGHLPPYCNGEELNTSAGLPLGVTAPAEYSEAHFHLVPGDTLTFLSDGVVEARNQAGELFGFERTRDLSTQSAQSIARAASTFGQEDDITVLTLTTAPVEAIHA